jgi:hypothetical protein
MSTHDYDLANQAGAAFRADLNLALAAILALNSNATAPATTVAGMLWYDTANGVVKQRNAANSAWLTRWTLTNEEGTFSGVVSNTDTTDATSTTAASVKTAGGLAVAKKLYVGDIIRLPNNTIIKARNAANSADQQMMYVNASDVLFVNGSFTASVANAGTLSLGTLQKGLLVIVDNSADACGIFVVSNLVTYEISDPDSKYSASAGTGSMTNLYNSAGSVILQNNSGGSRTYSITLIQ